MRPIVLHGHERAVTKIKFNRDGDILFSAGKDRVCTAWYADNGERIGTYDGHKGAINCVDVSYDTNLVLTGAGDSTSAIWDASTGRRLNLWSHDVAVSHVEFGLGDRLFINVTRNLMKRKSIIKVYKLTDDLQQKQSADPIQEIISENPKIEYTQASWGPLNKTIIATDSVGNLTKWDVETGKLLAKENVHAKRINSFSFDKFETSIITASSDHTAKLFDLKTFKQLKTYKTYFPVRAATISPLLDHVAIGGGQDAKEVTQTKVDPSQFAVRIYHKIFEDEIGKIKGHFGPIHSLEFSPDGRSVVSGAEDGFIRINPFDDNYFTTYSKQKEIEDLQIDLPSDTNNN